MNILSIQSHVVHGHVGNRSAVFPLERMGYEVWPINTVQFSCHSGRPGWTGSNFGGRHVHDLVKGLEAIHVLGTCDAILSGYMGDVETGVAILEAVAAVRIENPGAIYCCDPVMGDMPGGIYVKSDLPRFMAEMVVPKAEIVCPNVFEAGLLSGPEGAQERSIVKKADAIHALGPRIVIIKSYQPINDARLGFFISDGTVRKMVLAPVLPFPKPPKGSGDLASALFLGYYLKTKDIISAIEATLDALYAILEATIASGKEELAIIASQEKIANPPHRFSAESID